MNKAEAGRKGGTKTATRGQAYYKSIGSKAGKASAAARRNRKKPC